MLKIKQRNFILFILLLLVLSILLFSVINLFPIIFDDNEIINNKFEIKKGYYLSNSGNDLNNGTSPEQAWKSKIKLNKELSIDGCISDGDDIFFRRGDIFDEDVTIFFRKTDGTKYNPMIIGAYGTGPDPIISTNELAQINFLDDETGNWIFENLNFEGGTDHIAGNNGDKYNLTIRNCTFNGKNPGKNDIYGRVLLYNVHNYTIENCIFIDSSHFLYGDGVGERANSNTRMMNCIIDGQGGDQDNIQIHAKGKDPSGNGANHYIYNVTSYNCSANAFDIVGGFGSDNIYIKNCIAKECGNDPPIVIGHGVTNVTIENCYTDNGIYFTKSKNTIVRNSIFKQKEASLISLDDPQWDYGWGTQNLTIYHNTFISSGTNRFISANVGKTDPRNLSGFTVKNNIFYSIIYSAPDNFLYYDPDGSGIWNLSTTKSNFSYNCWWRGDGDFDNIRWIDEDGKYNLTEWNSNDEVYNDFAFNASLVNPTGNDFYNDFNLNANSPAIDAGNWLTYTIGEGVGTTISIQDANYFFPGIPSLGISGDNIFIGDDTNLEIIGVDYQNNTIFINRSITWIDGDNVSLSSYNGLAPDIGAYEFVFDKSIFH